MPIQMEDRAKSAVSVANCNQNGYKSQKIAGQSSEKQDCDEKRSFMNDNRPTKCHRQNNQMDFQPNENNDTTK